MTRPSSGARAAELLSFSLFALLMIAAQSFHERWFDETQAWLVAGDCSLVEIFSERAAYEGSPMLWHLLLYLPAQVGLGPSWVNYISGFFATVSVALILFASPFPIYVRILLPFTYFIGYQYSIVGRSYVLNLILVCLAARFFGERKKRPGPYFFCLALLANANSHGAIVAFGLLLADGFKVLTAPGTKFGKHIEEGYRPLWRSGWIVLLGLALAFLQVYPTPEDCYIGPARGGPEILREAFMGNLPAALVFLLISLYWFSRRGVVLYFLFPFAGLMILFTTIYFNYWHAGQIFLVWLFSAWISLFPNSTETASPRLERLFFSSVSIFCFVSIYQTSVTVRNDYRAPYCGSKEAAQYLQYYGLDKGQVWTWGTMPTSVLGDFSRNIFGNFPPGTPRYFPWSKRSPLVAPFLNVIRSNPEYVFMCTKFPNDREIIKALIDKDGYQIVKVFEGYLLWRTGIRESNQFVLLKRPE